ncbi:MAG: hypothetical protein WCO00_18515, partial [Rhodospirillaceae bacterium]
SSYFAEGFSDSEVNRVYFSQEAATMVVHMNLFAKLKKPARRQAFFITFFFVVRRDELPKLSAPED